MYVPSLKRTLLALALLAAAASGCSRAGPPRPTSHWVDSLNSPDTKVRREAVAQLARIGCADPTVVPALTGALRDPDTTVRAEAAAALAQFGPDAAAAAPALAAVAHADDDAKVRGKAAAALAKVRPEQ
jgi:HEAT repeat protein